jgi:hypothetical protein
MNLFVAGCRTLRYLPICLLVVSTRWGTQVQPLQRNQLIPINRVQQGLVSKLDPALPDVPLLKWLTVEAGGEAKITWNVSNCRNVQGISVDERRMFPVCVEADADMKDGRSIVLVFGVALAKPSSEDGSKFCFGHLETPHETISLHHLSDLPVALIKTHGTIGYPEIAQ